MNATRFTVWRTFEFSLGERLRGRSFDTNAKRDSGQYSRNLRAPVFSSLRIPLLQCIIYLFPPGSRIAGKDKPPAMCSLSYCGQCSTALPFCCPTPPSPRGAGSGQQWWASVWPPSKKFRETFHHPALALRQYK